MKSPVCSQGPVQEAGVAALWGEELQRDLGFESGSDTTGAVTASGCHLDPCLTDTATTSSSCEPRGAGGMLKMIQGTCPAQPFCHFGNGVPLAGLAVFQACIASILSETETFRA